MCFVIPQTITKSDVNNFTSNNDVMCILILCVVTVVYFVYISLQINTLLCCTLVSVLVLGIGIARGQYY